MSMAVLLSSKVPPLPKEFKWSYKDLQSLTPIGLLRFSTWSTSAKLKGPSMASDRTKSIHSAIPEATEKLWASPLRVDETTRGSLYDLQPMQWIGTSWPWEKAFEVNANIQPPCVFMLKVFAKAASDQKTTVRSCMGIYGTVIFKSDCCRARLTAWLACKRSWIVGTGKLYWDRDVCTAKSGRDWELSQPRAPLTARRAATSFSLAGSQYLRALSLEMLIGRMLSA